MIKPKEELNYLVDRLVQIYNSPKNQSNKKYWSEQAWYRDYWRGVPKIQEDGYVPFVVAPEMAMWHEILGVNLEEYYSNPKIQLEYQAKILDYKFTNWDDDYYFDGNISIWFGVITELSFFDTDIRFFENREGWIQDYLIKEEKDLDGLKIPDFYKSGLMPKIHEFYHRFNEIVDGRLPVMFPNWARSPFCMAAHLRGYGQLLFDMMENPKFVHRLMRFTTDARKAWVTERAKFLGTEIIPGHLYNDEVDCPTISPGMYEEFILPYEKELSEFQGGVTYWHSCGNTTKFLPLIKQTPNIKMFHASPWADRKEVANLMGNYPLDVCIEPNSELLERSPEEMKEILRQIKSDFSGTAYAVRADALATIRNLEHDLQQIKAWIEVAKEVLHEKG